MTRKWRGFLLEVAILLGAFLLQQTVIRWVAFGLIRPDLTLIALAAVALRHGSIAGLYAGLGLGLVQDVYAVDTLGANALAKCLVGYSLGFFEEKAVKTVPAIRVLLLGGAFLVHDVVFYLAAGFRGIAFWNAFLEQTLPAAIYTLLVGAGVFYSVGRIKPREV